MDEIEIEMKQLVQNYGLEILLEERRMEGLFADFFPKEKKLRKAVRTALDVGAGRMFFELAKSAEKDSAERLAAIRKKLVDEAWLSEAAADSVCRVFLAAIGKDAYIAGEINASASETAKPKQERTKAHDSISALKNSFAQTAYDGETDYGSVYRLALNWLDDEKKRNVISVSAQIDSMVKNGTDAASGQMKVIYAALVKKLAEEENEDYRKLLKQCAVRYAGLVDPPVPFYWNVSPIPPQSLTKGRISYYVSNAVTQSFSVYYGARSGRMEDIIAFLREAEETRISGLVMDFFSKVKGYEA